MPYQLLALAVVMTMLTTGCGPTAAKVDPEQLPRVLIRLESLTDEIIEAFDAGEPMAADRAMHSLGKVYSALKRQATASLDESQQAAINEGLDKHLDALAIVHAPMHSGTFPSDFDFEPVREQLTTSLEKIRAALPEEIVKKMQAAREKRLGNRIAPAADAEQAPTGEETGTEEDGEAQAVEAPAVEAGAALPPKEARAASLARAPLCPTVMLYDDESYRLAPERINRIAGWLADAPPDARWVQLVPTLHATLRSDGSLAAYGTMGDRTGSWQSSDNFTLATDGLSDRFREAFAAAIGQAVRRGLNVAILPHLDPAVKAEGSIEWRNHYRFRPAVTIGAGSYESLLIDPLAEAIEATTTLSTKIDFALSGEMGRSLFDHPADYLRLARRLRERFAGNPRTSGVRIGVALNWSGLAGEAEPTTIDRDAVAQLFTELDFVGYSCYAPVSVPPTSEDFANATSNFLEQLKQLGGTPAPSARLVISEVGVGGGRAFRSEQGNAYATVAETAAKPYEGSGNPSIDPWGDPELARFREQFHAALLEHLAQPQTPIEKAFLWSEGPWDPLGVASDRFRNDAITQRIATHNAPTQP